MKKGSLNALKQRNKEVILKNIIEYKQLSRIELAKQCDLSPSTVTALVDELMEEGVLVVGSEEASTGGRRRTNLEINASYGVIVVFQVQWQGIRMQVLDLNFEEIESFSLSNRTVYENDLFELIKRNIEENLQRKLIGIGIIFQEDMEESDFNIMISTSLSAEQISLAEALKMTYHVPIIIEFSGAFSISHRLEETEEIVGENYAYIQLGKRVLAQVVINGEIVSLGERKIFVLDTFVKENAKEDLTKRIAKGINAISVFFPIEQVFVCGGSENPSFLEGVEKHIDKQLQHLGKKPFVRKIKVPYESQKHSLGRRLCSIYFQDC